MSKNEKSQSAPRDSSSAFRISIYIYPNQMEWIDKISKDSGISKRSIFFEMIHMYIQDYKAGKTMASRS